MSHPNNQHVARLREMAGDAAADQVIHKHRWIKNGFSPFNAEYLAAQAKYERDAAALLAGAEALEAVEVAKAALREMMLGSWTAEVTNEYEDWCNKTWPGYATRDEALEQAKEAAFETDSPDSVALAKFEFSALNEELLTAMAAALARLEGK
jgi:hypothetical protein